MKIYTKTGDSGDTSLLGGKRIPKSSIRIDSYGSVDELNTQIGVVRSLNPNNEIGKILEEIQDQLFVLGADLASPVDSSNKSHRIGHNHIQHLEEIIDHVDLQLEPLKSFILPGGSPVSSQLHLARAVCRRAERQVDALKRREEIGEFPLIYLNRLGDLLFQLARFENKLSGIIEKKWKGNVNK